MEPSRITAEDARHKVDEGPQVLFLDTRSEGLGRSGSELPGARRIAGNEIEVESHTLPRDKLIIMYCT